MKIVLHERENGEWDYRFVADNGQILSVSEGYDSKGNAKRAVDSFIHQIKNEPYEMVTESKKDSE